MIDIPWTEFNPFLFTDASSSTNPTGFDRRRGEFMVKDDWCIAQGVLIGDPDFSNGDGLWMLALPVYSAFTFSMNFKLIGMGVLGQDGAPLQTVLRFFAREAVGQGVPTSAASHALMTADGLLFVHSGLGQTALNLHFQLAYRAHVNGLLGAGVEDSINAQHPDLLEFGTHVDWDAP